MDHDELKDLIPIMALDALGPQEEAEVIGHLKVCTECVALLVEHRRAAEELAFAAAPAVPPADLKDRIMAQAARTQRPAPAPAMQRQVVQARPRVRFSFRWAAVAGGFAAMALVAGIALQQLADARQQSNELAAMLTAQREAISLLSSSATEVLTMSATEDGEGIGGRVFLSGDGGQAAVLMNGLADTGKSIYTLWLIDGGVEEPVTDFGPDESGLAVLSIPKVEADTTIAVTLEPRAGNQKPEGPVLAVAFAA